jgi:hypothetical protein
MGLQVYSKVMGTSMKQLFEQYVLLYGLSADFY